jgi:hypothetical protein
VYNKRLACIDCHVTVSLDEDAPTHVTLGNGHPSPLFSDDKVSNLVLEARRELNLTTPRELAEFAK